MPPTNTRRPKRKVTDHEIDKFVESFENDTGLNFDDVPGDDDLLQILASYAAGTDQDVIHEVVDPQMLDRSRNAA